MNYGPPVGAPVRPLGPSDNPTRPSDERPISQLDSDIYTFQRLIRLIKKKQKNLTELFNIYPLTENKRKYVRKQRGV